MNILRYIPYVLILTLIIVIGYQQFTYKSQLSTIQNLVFENQNDLYEYKLFQKDNEIKIVNEINSYNNKRFGALNEKLNEISATTNRNRNLIDGLQSTTNLYETNYNNFTEDTRLQYTKTINELFNESAGLLVEISEAADRNTAAALMYKDILEKNYEIVNKHNQEVTNENVQ